MTQTADSRALTCCDASRSCISPRIRQAIRRAVSRGREHVLQCFGFEGAAKGEIISQGKRELPQRMEDEAHAQFIDTFLQVGDHW